MDFNTLVFNVTTVICLSLSTARGKPSTNTSSVSEIVKYVTSYIQSPHLGPEMVYARSAKRTPDTTILEKVKEMAPFFQDDDQKKLELEEEETTLFEFTPRFVTEGSSFSNRKNYKEGDTLGNQIQKFKAMRNRIEMALEKEATYETKQYVIALLDDLIATMLYKQCPNIIFRNSDIKKILRMDGTIESVLAIITFKDDGCYLGGAVKIHDDICTAFREPFQNCYIQHIRIPEEECRRIISYAVVNRTCVVKDESIAYKECDNVRKILSEKINDKLNYIIHNEHNHFMPQSNRKWYDLFNVLMSNYITSSETEKHTVRCSLINTGKRRKNFLRQADICQDFRVCSEEMRDFLSIFHKSLNDTVVRTFKNYAKTYGHVTGSDKSDDIRLVISIINQVSDTVKHKVASVFMKTTSTLTLDTNKDKENNIATLRQFVNQTINLSNKSIIETLDEDFESLSTKLRLSIKNDLHHSLAADLSTFYSNFIQKICFFFATCKGSLKLFKEESSRKWPISKEMSIDSSLITKVEFSPDDDLKRTIERKSQHVDPVKKKSKSEYRTNTTPFFALNITLPKSSCETDGD